MKWYEDLSIVAERFGVSEADILEFNGLSSAKEAKQLKTLKIPDRPLQKKESKELDSTFSSVGDTLSKAAAIDVSVSVTPEANLALVLPFTGEGSSESYFDFYSGVLMAVRDLGRSGMKINLSVYDYNADGEKFQRTDLSKFDLILGPISKDQIESVLNITPKSTLLVSPLDHKTAPLANSYSNFIQAPAAAERQYEDAVACCRKIFCQET